MATSNVYLVPLQHVLSVLCMEVIGSSYFSKPILETHHMVDMIDVVKLYRHEIQHILKRVPTQVRLHKM